ncbi:MAG: helix-turn-helix domain-containing protein [Archaeoglobaceae archaeon]
MIDCKIEAIECLSDRIRIRVVILDEPITIEVSKNKKEFEISFASRDKLNLMRVFDLKDIKPRTFAQKLSAVLEQDVKIKDTEVILAKLLPEILKNSEIFNENGRKREERREDEEAEIRRKAEEFLSRKDILKVVKQILDKRIVGEDENKLLLFLICLSKEIEPQACLLVSESGAGKSYMLHQVLEIFIEDVLWFSRVTPSALDRIGRDLTGKIFAIEEEAGITPEAEAMIRAWISEGQLKLLTTVKDEEGNIKTAEIETTGKPVFLSTTTKRRIDDERETRIWIISPDPSEEQTKLVNLFSAEREARVNFDTGDEEIRVLREALKILREENKGYIVKIPFATKLAKNFPSERVRARRDFKKLLALIKVSAYLHSRNRPKIELEDGTKVIIATPGDLGIVWRLITKAIKPTLTGLTPSHEDVLKVAEELKKEGIEEFTIYDLKTRLNYQKSRLSELVRELEAFGYLELTNEGGGRGKKATYKVTNYSEKTSILPYTSNGSIDDFFSQTELEEWLNENFHSNRVCNSAIYEKFVMNYYDPLSSNIVNASTEVERKFSSEADNSDLDGEKKAILPSEVYGSKEVFSKDSSISDIANTSNQVERKFSSEKKDDDSSSSEGAILPSEVYGSKEVFSRETNLVKLILIKEPPVRKILGVDGKEYEIPDLNVEFELPEANAELFLTQGYAMRVPYKCECGKAFPDKASLTKHQANCEEFQRRQNEEVLELMKARGWV